jgi:ABC-type nitrate/sulfonate/bicarbonate transport system ATPase subunit
MIDSTPTVFLGPSGCGKTTLLRLIAGLLKPATGMITIDDNTPPTNHDASVMCDVQTAQKISFAFQEPRLLPTRTIEQNITIFLNDVFQKDEAEKRARFFLDFFEIAGYRKSFPHELSGGQQQRASLARAFAYPAGIILLDEPFQSLDFPLRFALIEKTKKLLHDENRFCVAVTHDPREAVYMGERAIVLDKTGRVKLDRPVANNARAHAVEDELLEAIR